MPYSDTDEDYDLGNGPPMSRQVYDWYQKNASPIGDQLTNRNAPTLKDMARQEYERRQQNPQRYASQPPDYPLQPIANIPSKIYGALDWAGRNVAAPALGTMADVSETDWSQQPFIGIGEKGEFTGRLPALSSALAPYLLGAAPAGQGVLPAGLKLPGGKYGYPEGLEGGYHGTHTVFSPAPENQLGQFMDKFINTGEGAQAYGWGHYVGAKKGTGASYMPSADDMALHIGDQPWNPMKKQTFGSDHFTEEVAHDLLMDAPRIVTPNGHMPDVSQAIADLKTSIKSLEDDYTFYTSTAPEFEKLTELNVPQNLRNQKAGEIKMYLENDRKVLDFIQSNQDKFKFETPGSLYHVEIKPPEESLMHWDKKIKDQPPEVQEQLKQVNDRVKNDNMQTWESSQDMKAGDWYRQAKESPVLRRDYPGMTGNGQALSEAMKEAGIPGLRFADQHSRGIFNTKQEMSQTQANIDKLQDVVDKQLIPGTKPYEALLARGEDANGIEFIRETVRKEITKQMMDLQSYKDQLKRYSTIEFEGKPMKNYEALLDLSKGDGAAEIALNRLWQTKDVDRAINRIKNEDSGLRFDMENPDFIANLEAIQWLEKNRDKISLKEPDVTHNYVIFDPKNLNAVHRERNMPKGFI